MAGYANRRCADGEQHAGAAGRVLVSPQAQGNTSRGVQEMLGSGVAANVPTSLPLTRHRVLNAS